MFLITFFEKSLIISGSTLKTPLASCSKRLPNEQCGFILSHLQRSLSLIIVNNGALGVCVCGTSSESQAYISGGILGDC